VVAAAAAATIAEDDEEVAEQQPLTDLLVQCNRFRRQMTVLIYFIKQYIFPIFFFPVE